MLLAAVEYARPSTIEDAVRLLSAHDGARALAGGQTLTNVMKARAAAPDVLIDLNGLEELRTISRAGDGALELGAMATLSQVILSSEVAEARPILGDVASQIADVQVRNRGTIGGNICSNDPTNHLPPLIAALGRDDDHPRRRRRADRDLRGVLPWRLHDCRRARRAADEDHDSGCRRRR